MLKSAPQTHFYFQNEAKFFIILSHISVFRRYLIFEFFNKIFNTRRGIEGTFSELTCLEGGGVNTRRRPPPYGRPQAICQKRYIVDCSHQWGSGADSPIKNSIFLEWKTWILQIFSKLGVRERSHRKMFCRFIENLPTRKK